MVFTAFRIFYRIYRIPQVWALAFITVFLKSFWAFKIVLKAFQNNFLTELGVAVQLFFFNSTALGVCGTLPHT